MRLAPLVLFAVAFPAFAEDAVVTLGKQRAAKSPIEWEAHETTHPVLGPIHFAVMKRPIPTPAGSSSVFSRIYFSCEKRTKKIAIELTNQVAPDDPGGLRAQRPPQLVCHRPDGQRVAQEILETKWEQNDIGDSLAHELAGARLRQCASVDVVADVVLPKDWGPATARVTLEIPTYAKELDPIFVTCGERAAVASAESAAWREARTTPSGRTNVRARPSLDSPLVIQLFPGDVVLVQKAQGDWWHVRSRANAKTEFDGYIREDRLVFR